MQNLLSRYVNRIDFESYEDFKENFKIKVPKKFNFGYDIVDESAKLWPEKLALVWCDEAGAEAQYTFAQMKYYSDKTANFLRGLGIRKGDPVMLILKRRFEFWFCSVALHKLGAICIPATHLLTTKDLVYRCNAADIKMIISIGDTDMLDKIDEAQKSSPTLKHKAMLTGARDGWHNYTEEMERASDKFERPKGKAEASNDDIFLLYFTSGTTGMPKMVRHDFTYPLGHIITVKFWQNVQENKLHLTVADTGWAKAA